MNERTDSKNVDNVNPNHSQGTKCIEFMEVSFGTIPVLNFCLVNSFKYLWRYKDKNGEEDIKKAKWYLDYVVHRLDRDGRDNFPPDISVMADRLSNMYITVVDSNSNS